MLALILFFYTFYSKLRMNYDMNRCRDAMRFVQGSCLVRILALKSSMESSLTSITIYEMRESSIADSPDSITNSCSTLLQY